jgi:hypothetical protein
MNETDTQHNNWQEEQIEDEVQTRVRQELMATGDMGKIARALQTLADGLNPGQTRTIVRAPDGYPAEDPFAILTGTARTAAEAIAYGLDDIPTAAGQGPFQLLENQAVTEYTPVSPWGAPVGPGVPDAPTGYVQVAHTADGIVDARLGYLDMQTQTGYSMPLPTQP